MDKRCILFVVLFTGFRLVYIPASVLSHSGHGLPWLTAALSLLLTLGMEALVRSRGLAAGQDQRRRGLVATLVGLALVGLFPEEAPLGVILWAGIGAAWGSVVQGQPWLPARLRDWLLLLAGAVLGLTGLYGPGSWIMALLLVVEQRSPNQSGA